MDKRPKIPGSIVLANPRHGEPRDRIVHIDLDKKKPFIIAKTDVVAGLVFLDQLAFKQERLGFGAHGVDIQVIYRIDEGIKLKIPPMTSRGLEIRTDPLAQIKRFANINDRPKAVFHQIDPRLMRHVADFFPNWLRCRHRESFALSVKALSKIWSGR